MTERHFVAARIAAWTIVAVIVLFALASWLFAGYVP